MCLLRWLATGTSFMPGRCQPSRLEFQHRLERRITFGPHWPIGGVRGGVRYEDAAQQAAEPDGPAGHGAYPSAQ